MIHHSRGVYPSGDFVDNGIASEHLAAHIAYNLLMRPGRALIVDGFCISQGLSVSQELVDKHLVECQHIKKEKDTAPYR